MSQGYWIWTVPMLVSILGASTKFWISASEAAAGAHPDALAPGIILSFPSCIPHCTMADRDRLMADTTIEDKIVQAIEGAKRSIDFSTFTFNRERILQALIAAANRGVQVRGVVDQGQFATVGKACTPGGCVFSSPFASAEFLAKSPLERFEFAQKNKLWPADTSATEKLAVVLSGRQGGSEIRPGPRGRLVHNKFLLADRELLINGSANWSTTGLAINLESFEIATLQSAPEMIRAFSCLFEAVFASGGQSNRQQLKQCQIPRIWFTPAPAGEGPMGEILAAIRRATATIDISMHHFNSSEVMAALADARRRGVRVRIVFDDDDCVIKMPDELRRLGQAGADLRYLQTSCQMFQLSHNKFGIFDGKQVINGPANWTKAGMTSNYENFILYESPAQVSPFSALFEKIWAVARTRQECECNPREPACRQRFCLNRRLPH